MVFVRRNWRARILSRDRWIGRRLKWHLEWKLPDFWIGAFWRNHHDEAYGIRFVYAREIWVCLLPCLPLCITTFGHDAKPGGSRAPLHYRLRLTNWLMAKPWRWHYRTIYRTLRNGSRHPTQDRWIVHGEPMGRLRSVWVAATFPHVHFDLDGRASDEDQGPS